MDMGQRSTELCKEATGREEGATVLVVLRLGQNVPGEQNRWRDGQRVKAQRQERSVTNHQDS